VRRFIILLTCIALLSACDIPDSNHQLDKPPLFDLFQAETIYVNTACDAASDECNWSYSFDWDSYQNNIFPINKLKLPGKVAEAAAICDARYGQKIDNQHINIFCLLVLEPNPVAPHPLVIEKDGFAQSCMDIVNDDYDYIATECQPAVFADSVTGVTYRFGLPSYYRGDLPPAYTAPFPFIGEVSPFAMQVVNFAPDAYRQVFADFIADVAGQPVAAAELRPAMTLYETETTTIFAFEVKIGQLYYYYPVHLSAEQALLHNSDFTCTDNLYGGAPVCFASHPYTIN